MKQKILLTLTLWLFLLGSLWAQTATPPSGSGTSGSPYLIANVNNLYWLSQTSSNWAGSYYYKQTANINLTTVANWKAVGTDAIKFAGNYDGGGFTITNLKINATTNDQGLFGSVTDATIIKNLTVENAQVTSTVDYAGILVATNRGQVINCHVKGGSISGRSYIGGISGVSIGISGKLASYSQCTNSATVTSSSSRVGGLFGEAYYSNINDCKNTGTVICNVASGPADAGGIVGYIPSKDNIRHSTISNCYNSGSVTATNGNSAGGILGSPNGATMSNCYSEGTVTAATQAGGLTGWCHALNTFTNCCTSQAPAIGDNATAPSVTNVLDKPITFTSTNTGVLSFELKASTSGPLYIDWGNGTLLSETASTSNTTFSTSSYVAGSTVKVYGANINYLNCDNKNITALNVSNSTTLRYLYCSNNSLTTLNVSNNTVLSELYCSSNSLSSLNVTNNTALTYLYCYGNNSLSSLDVSKNTALIAMRCNNNSLSSLDVSKNTALGYLYCNNNNLTTLNVSNNTDLKTFQCYNNSLSALDVSKNTVLSELYCSNNSFLSLNVTNNTALTYLYCDNNSLSSLDVSKNTKLKTLQCYDNSLSSLVVTNNTALTQLSCNNNSLSALDVSKNTALVDFSCQNNKLSFSTLPQVKTAYTYYNYAPQTNLAATCTKGVVNLSSQLTAVDVNGNTQTTEYKWYKTGGTLLVAGVDYLANNGVFTFVKTPGTKVYCTMTNIAFSSFSGANILRTADITVDAVLMPNITMVSTNTGDLSFVLKASTAGTVYIDWGNGILQPETASTSFTTFSTSTYVAGSTVKVYGANINYLNCDYKNITALDVSNNTALTQLYCYANSLSVLDISKNTALTSLDCDDNNLSALNVSKNTELTSLNCNNNSLSVLDLSKNTLLKSLYCSSNILSDLDVSKNTALTSLGCDLNNLSVLDVSKNTALTTLYCNYNNLSTLDVSFNTALKALGCKNNKLSFSTLPQVKTSYTYYTYAPQTNFAATCTNGVVDLSAQLTAIDAAGNTQTTEYKWYKTDGTQLVAGVDYLANNGVFTFVKTPGTTVYCTMTNAAFPSLSGANILRTADIEIDAIAAPNITMVSTNAGNLSFILKASTEGSVYIDWGIGILISETAFTSDKTFSTSSYVAGNTVKVYGANIQDLDCSERNLSALDVSNNSALTSLYCGDNSLSALDVNNNTALTTLYCYDNSLTALDVSNNTALTELNCHKNSLTALDVSNNTALISFKCYENSLTALDISNNKALTVLDCEYNNSLSVLDVSNNKDLIVLFCSYTNLSTLDVSNNTALEYLYCYNNNLSALDLSKNTALTALSCNNNNLSFATLPQVKTSYSPYEYAPQANVAATCTNGVVDLSEQLTAINDEEVTQTTEYKWYQTNGTLLVLGEDYMANAGVFTFVKKPASTVYCTMSNAAFPNFSGANSLRTVDITVNAVLMPNITMVSTNTGSLSFELRASTEGAMIIDWGNGILIPETASTSFTTFSTSSYVAGSTVKVYGANIQHLSCGNQNLSALDVSNNTALTTLNCFWNSLSVLDVSANTALKELYCSANSLSVLDVSSNRALTNLYCENNNLSTLEVNSNTVLTQLYCSGNKLSDLNVSSNTALTQLYCSGNKLSDLNVSSNTALTTLSCNNNNLSFSTLPQAKSSYSQNYNYAPQAKLAASCTNGVVDLSEQLTAINDEEVTQTTEYKWYQTNGTLLVLGEDYIANNGVFSFMKKPASDVYCTMSNAAFPAISGANILRTANIEVDAVIMPNITLVSANIDELSFALKVSTEGPVYIDWGNGILQSETASTSNTTFSTSTYVAGSTVKVYGANIQYLNCYGKKLTALDVSNNTALTTLACNNNSLSVLDVSKNTALTELNCSFNNLSALDVNNNTALTMLYCNKNSLSTLEVSNNTALTTLWCYSNNLSDLNVSNNTALTLLYCDDNNLSILDVRKNTKLGHLSCTNTNISALNVSENSALTTLYCDDNNLSALDVSNNSVLQRLACNGNSLSFATLPQVKTWYSTYDYAPQANVAATCTNGVVDLSAQFTATDKDNALQTTEYQWYQTGGTQLVLGEDYLANNGVFTFVKTPTSAVYCSMTNAAFPNLSGANILRTADIEIDAIAAPNISMVSTNTGNLSFELSASTEGSVYIDWGNGILLQKTAFTSLTSFSTSSYVAGSTVKVYGANIQYLDCRDEKLSALDVSNNTALTTLYCSQNSLTTLDVSNNTALTELYCNYNSLGTLDVSNNTALTTLSCNNNNLSFSTLPQAKSSYSQNYNYAPQAKLAASCTNGVVDLSEQLTAINDEEVTQTTEYKWYQTNGTLLVLGEDYIANNGVFSFMKKPASDVYCTMSNAAFPAISGANILRTANIEVDAVIMPNITLVSANIDELSFALKVSTEGPVYIDWGNGILLPKTALTSLTTFSTSSYVAGSTVKVYGANIQYLDCRDEKLSALDVSNNTALTELYCDYNSLSALNVSNNTELTTLNCSDNSLTALDISKNTALTVLSCYKNSLSTLDVSKNTALTVLYCESNNLSFATLPQVKTSYTDYTYAPQTNLVASCTNGVVDLSAQLTAINAAGNTQTTEYQWYQTGGTLLVLGIDYIANGGVFSFMKKPASDVYCTMSNTAFPGFMGENVLRTTDITIDAIVALPEPSITFVSENSGNLSFELKVSTKGTVYIDWGNGILQSETASTSNTTFSTSTYVVGSTVKVYGANIQYLACNNKNLTALDVSNNTALIKLFCNNNSLSSLDVSKNTALTELDCYYNSLSTLDVSYNTALTELFCYNNSLSALNVSNNTTLKVLSCSSNSLNTLNVSNNTALTGLYCYNNILSSLNVSNNTALTQLNCSSTSLSVLDVSNNTALTMLNCSSNSLSVLNVSNNTALTELSCSSNSLTALDVSNNTALTKLYCDNNSLSTLNVTNNTALTSLSCNYNSLSTLNVTNNTALTSLYCDNNSLSFSTLPQAKTSYSAYSYAPQTNLAATCTNGVVDLSAQLSVVTEYGEGDRDIHITKYTWYTSNNEQLVSGIDYIANGGVFSFMKKPASTVYCTMTNAAVPNFIGDDVLRTVDIAIDAIVALPEPTITFVSENMGDLSFTLRASTEGPVIIDWGNGILQYETASTSNTTFSTSSYVAGSTVKVYGANINYLDCYQQHITALDVSNNTALTSLDCGINGLSVLDVSKNTALTLLYCDDNKLSFSTLPQVKTSQTNYVYAPQSQLAATCTNGVIDLSTQLTAVDYSGQLQTTVYTWYNADGTPLASDIDYIATNGVFTFIDTPISTVYCEMTNNAFPDLTLYTEDITLNYGSTIPEDKTILGTSYDSDDVLCFGAYQTITLAGNGEEVNCLSGSSLTLIAGSSIKFLPGFHAQVGSYVNAHITADNSFCNEPLGNPFEFSATTEKSSEIELLDFEEHKIEISKTMKIYPNPNNGQFTIELTNFDQSTIVHVFNALGGIVYHSTFHNETKQEIDLSQISKGIYFVRANNGKDQHVQKIIIN